MSLMFNFPNLQSLAYAPGPQPYDPGNSVLLWGGTPYTVKPWPGIVPTIKALAGYGGIAQMRAPTALNNNWAFLPTNNLFIGGFVGKT